MNDVRFLAAAEEEMTAAARFYERQCPGLGQRFLDEVERAMTFIQDMPEASPVIHSSVRRKLLRHFPHALLYRLEPERIIVLAVMHLRRKPGYWKDRGAS